LGTESIKLTGGFLRKLAVVDGGLILRFKALIQRMLFFEVFAIWERGAINDDHVSIVYGKQ
jgi:hypothetical protein